MTQYNIDTKTLVTVKHLLQNVLTDGLNILSFKPSIRAKCPATDFEKWFAEIVILCNMFSRFKDSPSPENRNELMKQVLLCEYTEQWLNSVIFRMEQPTSMHWDEPIVDSETNPPPAVELQIEPVADRETNPQPAVEQTPILHMDEPVAESETKSSPAVEQIPIVQIDKPVADSETNPEPAVEQTPIPPKKTVSKGGDWSICLYICLSLMTGLSVLFLLGSLLNAEEQDSPSLALISVGSLVASIMLWLKKRIGFWLYLASLMFLSLINDSDVYYGFGTIELFCGGILYGCLQLRKRGQSFWRLMEPESRDARTWIMCSLLYSTALIFLLLFHEHIFGIIFCGGILYGCLQLKKQGQSFWHPTKPESRDAQTWIIWGIWGLLIFLTWAFCEIVILN
jgi:hypothetical protein